MQLLPSCEQLLTLYVDCLRVTDSRVDFVSTPALHYCAPSFPTFLASLQYSRREGGRFEVILCEVETVVFSPWNNFYFSGEINSFFFLIREIWLSIWIYFGRENILNFG